MIRLSPDEVEDAPQAKRPRAYVHPRPATHAFSVQAWRRANPGGNVEAAIAKARAFGYEVVK